MLGRRLELLRRRLGAGERGRDGFEPEAVGEDGEGDAAARRWTAATHLADTRAMPHDAFVSYSHAGERALAAALQKEMQRLGKRWWQRRALRVFRDETNLAAAPQLWDAVARELDGSAWLIVMASPRAAASPWVDRELAHWRARKDPGRVLVALCAGTLAWDPARGDFDWDRTDALPRTASGVFRDEPLWVDLRETDALDATRVRTAAARLAAPIHGKPFDDLLSDDLRAHRRALRLAWTVAAVLLVLAAAAIVAGIQAVRSGDEAKRQLRTANARRLALQGGVAERIDRRPDLALLLAVESQRLEPSREAARVLLDALGGVQDAEVLLHGRGGAQRGVAFSEDGSRISAVDEREEVLTWELAAPGRAPAEGRYPVADGALHISGDGREVVVELEGLQVAVDRTSRLAARAKDDGSVVVWRYDTAARVARLPRQGASPWALAFAPGGDVIAVGDTEGAVRIWSVRTGRLVAGPFRGHGAGEEGRTIRAVALGPGGRHLASAGDDGRVLLWDLAARPAVPRLVKHLPSTANRLVFNWNGSLLAAAYSEVAELWDVEALETRWTLAAHSGVVHDVAFAPDGRRAATASQDGTLVIWALEDRASLVRRFEARAPVVAAAFAPDGTRAHTVGLDGSVVAWDFSRFPAASRELPVRSGAGSQAGFTGNGRWLVIAEGDGRELVRWDLEHAAPERVVLGRLPEPAQQLATAQARACVAVVTIEDELVVMDAAANGAAKPLLDVHAATGPAALALAPECDAVAAGSLRDGFSLWDVSTGRRRDVPDEGEVFGIALDGRGRLATAGNGTIQLWRTDDLTRVGPAFPAHPRGRPVALAFDSDRRRLLSSGGDALVHLWDLDAIAAGPLTISELQRAAYAVAFSRDGAHLLLGDGARTVSFVESEPARWADRACALANRDLTPAEWQTYLAPAPYRRTCGAHR